MSLRSLTATATVLLIPTLCLAQSPTLTREGATWVVEGDSYRAIVAAEALDFALELKGTDGQWRPVTKTAASFNTGVLSGADVHSSHGTRATGIAVEVADMVHISRRGPISRFLGLEMVINCICTRDGILMSAELARKDGAPLEGSLWAPARLTLEPEAWDTYWFRDPDGTDHSGAISSLGPVPGYAGVSTWGDTGDTVKRLNAQAPALIVRSQSSGTGLGVVFVDYEDDWARGFSFLQRHTPANLYFYTGYIPAGEPGRRWAWLAPFGPENSPADAERAAKLASEGARLAQAFTLQAPPVPDEWLRDAPEFPSDLASTQPVADIRDAIIYTMGERTSSEYSLALHRKAGSDMIVRGWFKWAQAPPVHEWAAIPGRAHEFGALFGGGITCSALYDTENGITREQLLDMATRAPNGELVDAWDQPGTRHGSLSCPAYIDYLFRWCREQIDAGVDYLFMDEHTAALSRLEGYDDYSLRDFRHFLLEVSDDTRDWADRDSRWISELNVPLDDHTVCPSGGMDSFDYREYLRLKGLLDVPTSAANRMGTQWSRFRAWRDDRAWKALTDRIRAYAAEKGRPVLISANGLAKYVDLQVLGVWGQWAVKDGHIELSDNQLPYWRSLVTRGRRLAGSDVPVVLFHDWGFGDPPFPWLAVAPSEREVWMRTRGAEIYAAGAIFAYPVLGPFNCDAARDGTFSTIARQTAFIKRNRDLYQESDWLGSDGIDSDPSHLSLAAWWNEGRGTLVIHVINRNVRDGALIPAQNVTLRTPLTELPTDPRVISPDFDGERAADCKATKDGIEISFGPLDAYSIVLLKYEKQPDSRGLRDSVRIRPMGHWERPARSDFAVLPGCDVDHPEEVEGYLQGMLHQHLRNPPVFRVNALKPAELLVNVKAVATQGARLELSVDGIVTQTEDFPDLDGLNNGSMAEYDKTVTFRIPAGEHRVKLDNVGGDWAVLSWLEFRGDFGPPPR